MWCNTVWMGFELLVHLKAFNGAMIHMSPETGKPWFLFVFVKHVAVPSKNHSKQR